ncbi:MAG: hypothetical protein LBC20_17930, partial [Planctomycetaceae bacterium]|nr:hypothetical protein [Planctomycetaceae bacterium]
VKILRNVDDHPPAHLHVEGHGQPTRIGMNGKPIKNDPELSPQQRKVVKDNISTIRKAVRKIRQWFKYEKGQENG